MKNTTAFLTKYNNLEAECVGFLTDFLEKCPNKSWKVNMKVGIQTGHFATCEKMFLSPTQGLSFLLKDYVNWQGDNIITSDELTYGVMARIIGTLPNDVEFEIYSTLQGFLLPNYNIGELLSERPFFCDGATFGKVQITDIDRLEERGIYLNGLKNGGDKFGWHYCLDDKVVRDLIAHLEKSIMLCSEQYKIIKSYLDLQENLNLDINGEVTMECKGVTFKVLSIDTTDGEGFNIHGVVADNEKCYIHTDVFTLRPQNLDGLVDYLRKRLTDINGYFVFVNLKKAFDNNTASTIYDAIIDDVIIETMTHSNWNLQKAFDNVILKRMGLVYKNCV